MAGNTAAEGKVPTAAEIETMVSEARAAGFGTATEIVELCAMVGMPELSAEFITSRKPVAEVRTALMAKRVEKDKAATNGKELEPGITPGAEVGGGQPKAASWRSVLGGLGARLKPEVK